MAHAHPTTAADQSAAEAARRVARSAQAAKPIAALAEAFASALAAEDVAAVDEDEGRITEAELQAVERVTAAAKDALVAAKPQSLTELNAQLRAFFKGGVIEEGYNPVWVREIVEATLGNIDRLATAAAGPLSQAWAELEAKTREAWRIFSDAAAASDSVALGREPTEAEDAAREAASDKVHALISAILAYRPKTFAEYRAKMVLLAWEHLGGSLEDERLEASLADLEHLAAIGGLHNPADAEFDYQADGYIEAMKELSLARYTALNPDPELDAQPAEYPHQVARQWFVTRANNMGWDAVIAEALAKAQEWRARLLALPARTTAQLAAHIGAMWDRERDDGTARHPMDSEGGAAEAAKDETASPAARALAKLYLETRFIGFDPQAWAEEYRALGGNITYHVQTLDGAKTEMFGVTYPRECSKRSREMEVETLSPLKKRALVPFATHFALPTGNGEIPLPAAPQPQQAEPARILEAV